MTGRRFVVNAIGLSSAGGRSVGINFFRALPPHLGEDRVEAYVPSGKGYEKLGNDRIRIHPVGAAAANPWTRSAYERLKPLERLGNKKADAVFSMGNIALRTRLPQLLLFHWPYAIYPNSPVWERMDRITYWKQRIRRRHFARRLRYASVVAVQTNTAQTRFQRLFPGVRTVVIPNAISDSHVITGSRSRTPSAETAIRLLCLTRYYPHKNLEVLLDVAQLVKERNLPIRFVLTIAPEQHRGAKLLLDRIDQRKVADIIQNIGPVPMSNLRNLYAASDGLILPTLLESFSGTYIEAMAARRPILTSDRDFARDVCGDAAVYFDPLDPGSILDAIETVRNDRERIEQSVTAAHGRLAEMPKWDVVAEAYIKEMRALADRRRAV